MQSENQYLIEELDIVRRQINPLFSLLNDECQCFDALRKIQMLEGLLNSIIVKMIYRQLNESIGLIKIRPSLYEYKEELNRLLELYRTVKSKPIHYQLIIDKVEHE